MQQRPRRRVRQGHSLLPVPERAEWDLEPFRKLLLRQLQRFPDSLWMRIDPHPGQFLRAQWRVVRIGQRVRLDLLLRHRFQSCPVCTVPIREGASRSVGKHLNHRAIRQSPRGDDIVLAHLVSVWPSVQI